MHSSVPEAPSWIESLPKDDRGFPIPAEAPWKEDGTPSLKDGDVARTVLLACTSSCSVCGLGFAPGQHVYRAFAQEDAEQIRANERELTGDLNGPTHLSCILYSAFACPFLASPGARLQKGTMYEGSGRGERPAILGFRSWGVMELDRVPRPLIGYVELVEDHGYSKPQELVDLYADALVADREYLADRLGSRAFWGSDYGPRMVTSLAEDAFRTFRRRNAERAVSIAKLGDGLLVERSPWGEAS